jgi:hypothetical protein
VNKEIAAREGKSVSARTALLSNNKRKSYSHAAKEKVAARKKNVAKKVIAANQEKSASAKIVKLLK